MSRIDFADKPPDKSVAKLNIFMKTFLQWLNEADYAIDRHAKWGLAVPAKNKKGYKMLRGDTHPTATVHDHLAKEHFKMDTKDLLKKHPGSVRYLYQHNPDHELQMELTTHPKSTATARNMIKDSGEHADPKKGAFGGYPHKITVDFHDKPGRNFDTEYADDPWKHADKQLRGASLKECFAAEAREIEYWN